MRTVTAREFNRDVSAAKRAARESAVVITDRGTPSHVLLSYADYRRIIGGSPGLASRLSMDDEIDFEPVPLSVELRVADL